MLNIINLLKKSSNAKIFNKTGNSIPVHKKNIPLSKEWYNSLYLFSKNSIRIFPVLHQNVFKLIKAYLNMYNKQLETRINKSEYKKIKSSLSNKIWLSTPEIKHYNDKAVITVYIYNRLYNIYKKELSLIKFTWGPNVKLSTIKNRNKETNIIKQNSMYVETDKKSQEFYVKIIKWLKLDKSLKVKELKENILKLISKDSNKLKSLNILNIERYNFLINQFKLELLYLKLKQKILFNRFKFTEVYLTLIIDYLQTIYNKKVEFNFVMLNNHYLSSSILSQIIIAKVTNKKNRGNPIRSVYYSMSKPYIPTLSSNKFPRIKKTYIGMQNTILNENVGLNLKEDTLNNFLYINNKKSKLWSSNYIDNLALTSIENRDIAGIFIKVAGRLTKRYKAQRAVSILRSRGTLKNVYSAHKGFSSVLSRGYTNINIEKSMISSKVRIGAFGITGWVASY